MKKNLINSIVFDVFFSLVLILFMVNAVIFARCFNASQNLSMMDTQLMRVLIYGSSDEYDSNTISANISILDRFGNDVAVIERSWKGNYLSISFSEASFSGKNFYFPEKIFCTETISSGFNLSNIRGTLLTRYYLENGECFLYGRGAGEKDKKNLYLLSVFSKSPIAKIADGFSKKYTVNLAGCESGIYYGIFCDEKGKLVLRKQ